jgi:hypothetical protein
MIDPECITARILAEELQRAMAKRHVLIPTAALGAGIPEQTVRYWAKGEHVEQIVRFFALMSYLEFDVVFRDRNLPRRDVRLVRAPNMVP